MSGPLFVDLETCSAAELFSRTDGFVRLCGYAGVDGEVTTTTDVDELIQKIKEASHVVGHNVMGFDLLALAYHHGLDWETTAAKAIDSDILVRLIDPPKARNGYEQKHYDLDSVAKRMGVDGKFGDVKAMARKHGGFDKIPTDDPDFVDYLKGDVKATREVAKRLPMTDYAKREHELAIIAGHITLEGFRVDEEYVNRRIAEDEVRKTEVLTMLHDVYGVPITDAKGRPLKSPLASKAGKERLAWLFEQSGVKYPVTEKTGALKTSREDMEKMISDHPDNPLVTELCGGIVDVTTLRTVYKTVRDNTVNGRVHPTISMRQASGRWSMTRPGLTVLGKRGGKFAERDMFLPEPGHVLMCFDLSQVDMRAIAGHCQDPAYLKLFEKGRDAHTEIALAVFGDESFRSDAKVFGHGYNYGMSVNGMIRNGADPKKAEQFFSMMGKAYPKLSEWRDRIRNEAAAGALIDNGFGRLLRPDPERAFTQAPALYGQGTARDILCEGLLRLPKWIRKYIRAIVHDEVVATIPIGRVEEFKKIILDALQFEWRGVQIEAGATPPGESWGRCYA